MKFIHPLVEFLARKSVFRPLILITSILLIVWMMPREGGFNYQFEIGKPWKYGLLTAPYDFPVYKDAASVRLEQDSLMRYHRPYLAADEKIGAEAVRQLRRDCAEQLSSRLPYAFWVYLERALTRIYEKGIIDGEVYHRLQNQHVSEVMIMHGQTAVPTSLKSLYTLKSAYQELMQRDTLHFSEAIFRQCDLGAYLQPSLKYDSLKSTSAKEELLASAFYAIGIEQAGQKIVDRGEIVDKSTFLILESFRQASVKHTGRNNEQFVILGGQLVFVSLLLAAFVAYLLIYRPDYMKRRSRMLLIFSLITLFSVLSSLLVGRNLINVYVIPFAMLPIILHVLLDSRTAFLAHVTTVLICSISLHYPHEFILLQLLTGMAAIYSLRELSQRSQLYRVAVMVLLTYSFLNISLELMQQNEIASLNLNMYLNFLINGALLLFTYPLLFVLEKLFCFTSNVTLLELSNTNTPLLRRLSEEAPGTFNHSIQVSNLVAAAAAKIGANAQLARTGALYHDIGKIDNPMFFTENQGNVNPHKQLSYEQSAKIVINHVSEGLCLADKYTLPQSIKDFISTHHGLGVARYFLISWMNENEGHDPDLQSFSYPGPNPRTKETALLMMADAVEAASRSLDDYSDESIINLVNKIIDSQVEEGFFNECDLTFRDIFNVKIVFSDKLKSMYHPRVSYPQRVN